MRLRNKHILIIITTVLVLFPIAFRNTNKTFIKFFNWESKEISLGTLISISFLAGLSFNILVNKSMNINNTNINKIKNNAESKNSFQIDDDNQNEKINLESKEEFVERPPERELSDSQPTISVNYRVVKENKDEYENKNDSGENYYENNLEDWKPQDDDW